VTDDGGLTARHRILAMANKALSKRQKLTFRVEPSQKALKPRNPLPVSMKQRAVEPQHKAVSASPRLLKQILKKTSGEPDES
jgi:hypothetical protein